MPTHYVIESKLYAKIKSKKATKKIAFLAINEW